MRLQPGTTSGYHPPKMFRAVAQSLPLTQEVWNSTDYLRLKFRKSIQAWALFKYMNSSSLSLGPEFEGARSLSFIAVTQTGSKLKKSSPNWALSNTEQMIQRLVATIDILWQVDPKRISARLSWLNKFSRRHDLGKSWAWPGACLRNFFGLYGLN